MKERGIYMKDEKNIKESYSYGLYDKYEIENYKIRRLYINDEINNETVETVVHSILNYNREDKGIPTEQRAPIILYINSNGGSVTDGYSVIDVIVASKTPVYTVNQGYCYSMGFLIFLAGHKRYSMISATYLMHDGSTMGWDSTAKMKDRMDFETNQLEKYTEKYIISRTNIDAKLYAEKYRIEWYMYPTEAKKYGICTHIVGVDCDIDEIV